MLTISDIRAVGPDIWNDWKGSLLRELYSHTTDYLAGQPALAPKAKANAAKEQLFERLPEKLAQRVKPLFATLPDEYFISSDMSDLVFHARFMDQVSESGRLPKTAINIRRDRKRDNTQLWVLTEDRAGLFADLSFAISASQASITGARLFTGEAGQVMNVFNIQNEQGLAFGRENDLAIKLLNDNAQKAVAGDTSEFSLPKYRRSSRAKAIPVRPRVTFTKAGKSDREIVEVVGRDRPGLLWMLTQVFHTYDIDILSAHIENVGVQAMDTFYVRSRKGQLLDAVSQDQLKKALLVVLRESEGKSSKSSKKSMADTKA